MADGFLESHYADYEKRKAEWLRRKQSYSYQLSLKKRNNGTKITTDPA